MGCFKCRRVAYHEAGHAVAGVLLGREVLYATIQPKVSDNTLGYVRYRSKLPPDANAVTTLAGPFAEAYAMGGNKYKWEGAEGDWENLVVALVDAAGLLTPENLPIVTMYMHTSECYERLGAAEARTRDVLDRNWLSVVHVAEELLNNGELSGAAIGRIMLEQDDSHLRMPRARWGLCADCRTRLKRQRRTRRPRLDVHQHEMFALESEVQP